MTVHANAARCLLPCPFLCGLTKNLSLVASVHLGPLDPRYVLLHCPYCTRADNFAPFSVVTLHCGRNLIVWVAGTGSNQACALPPCHAATSREVQFVRWLLCVLMHASKGLCRCCACLARSMSHWVSALPFGLTVAFDWPYTYHGATRQGFGMALLTHTAGHPIYACRMCTS